MAVVRVIGTIDGVEVTFDRAQGDVWQVPVPLDDDGEYVVEIIAEDDAGNRSYLTKLLFAVNAAQLCVHVVPVPYYGALLPPAYGGSVQPAPYYAELVVPECDLPGRRLTACRN